MSLHGGGPEVIFAQISGPSKRLYQRRGNIGTPQNLISMHNVVSKKHSDKQQ
jgi:hypothetical protein